MTKYLTPQHNAKLVRQVWDLRSVLERMSRQLYMQYVMMRGLVRIASEEAMSYFAQRRPSELAKFEWTIDAKDPRRITPQAKWWRQTLAPLLESASRRESFIFVKDHGFNYKYFDRSFAAKKEMWLPNSSPKMIEGHDIRKMMTERMAFVVSESEILIQTVDILTSFLRRLLAREITGDDVSRSLGKLRIRKTQNKHPQSLRIVTLSNKTERESELLRTLRVMARAARPMLKPERTGRRPAQKS